MIDCGSHSMRNAFHVKIHRPQTARVHPAALSQPSTRASSSGRLRNCIGPLGSLKTRTGNCQLRALSSAVASFGRSYSSSKPPSRTPITRSRIVSRPRECPEDDPSLVCCEVSYLLSISNSSPTFGADCGDSPRALLAGKNSAASMAINSITSEMICTWRSLELSVCRDIADKVQFPQWVDTGPTPPPKAVGGGRRNQTRAVRSTSDYYTLSKGRGGPVSISDSIAAFASFAVKLFFSSVKRASQLAAVLGNELGLPGGEVEDRNHLSARFAVAPGLVAPDDLEQLVHCLAPGLA